MKALKKLPNCESARIVFAPESNLAFSASYQDFLIKARSNLDIITLTEDTYGKAGIRTDNNLKKLMTENFRTYLANGKVKFARNFISLSAKNPQKTKDEMIHQLREWSIMLNANKKGAQASKHVQATELFTGKSGRDSDDVAVATMLSLWAYQVYQTRPAYEQYRGVRR